MKRLSVYIFVILLSGITFLGCQENNIDNQMPTSVDKTIVGDLDYEILLIDAGEDNGDGSFTWTWSVTNTNPGNGKNGTFQDLSHWNFVPSACLFDENIVSAAYGTDLSALTAIDPAPMIAVDPSTSECNAVPVFKFNFGTSGGTTMYYQLIVNKEYEIDPDAVLYWKAGNTCDTGIFDGIGCDKEEEDCTEETGWGGGSEGSGSAWWFYFDTDAGLVQKIYAGQNETDGTITYDPISGIITINLGSWELRDVNEPVKVEGYNVLPPKRPSAGLFNLYKGSDLVIEGNGSRYYSIHLDIQLCE